ncbi:hypothetical protein PsAD2_04113 [Pseudovibrio axinellae]|uniref:DoxX n=1 Tax=Pseudovibrio axinellae TaxID=989403 RepID=A0A165U0U1_9HYPH|nr:hypothetical protein [Pseudovibrio axinellae]KZL09109.1 hypothetical protein PsAD2_04113 [Pseudovibrio axinellae]SER75614.1 hypothetical protein SAMN05421798_12020 [Pseudovibrio axinellae]
MTASDNDHRISEKSSTGMSRTLRYLRVFLGVFTLFFGVNRIFHFLPEPPWPVDAQSFLAALYASGYMSSLITMSDIFVGALLILNLAGRAALIMALPIYLHSMLFHVFLAPETMLFALIGLLLNIGLIVGYFPAYRSLMKPL